MKKTELNGITEEPVSKQTTVINDLEMNQSQSFTRLSDKLIVGWKLLSLGEEYFERKFTSYQNVKRLECIIEDDEFISSDEYDDSEDTNPINQELESKSQMSDSISLGFDGVDRSTWNKRHERTLSSQLKARITSTDRLDEKMFDREFDEPLRESSNFESSTINSNFGSSNLIRFQEVVEKQESRESDSSIIKSTSTSSLTKEFSQRATTIQSTESSSFTQTQNSDKTTIIKSTRQIRSRTYEPKQLPNRFRDNHLSRFSPYWLSYKDEVHHQTHPAPFWKSFPFLVNTETIDKPPFRTEMHRIHYYDNEYLKTGYRIMPNGSLIGALWSILAWNHNEFVNIHSHLWAGIIWCIIAIIMFIDPTLFGYQQVPEDFLMFFFYALSCCFVFLGSTSFHTFRCCSVHAYHRYLAVDFCGICNLLMAGVILISYFELKCFPRIRTIMILIVLFYWFALIFITPCLVYFRITAERTMAFLVLIFLGLISFIIKLWFDTTGNAWITFPDILFGYTLTSIIIVCRTIKYPEKLFPKIFDIFGASHQLWHIVSAWLSFYCFNVYVKNNNLRNFDFCDSL